MLGKSGSRLLILSVMAFELACSEQDSDHPHGAPEASVPGGGGATGGSSSSGGAGAGGVAASGGSVATGGISAAGGTGSGGTASGGSGTGGSPPGSGGALPASGGAPSDGGHTGSGCDGLPVCSSFESETVGAAPLGFTVVNPEMDNPPDTATVDGIGAHGSSRSLKVVSHGRIWVRASRTTGGIAALGPSLHARFFVRFENALPSGHSSFVAFDVAAPHDDYDENNELRFGSQEGALHWNAAFSDRNVPSVNQVGKAASFAPAPGTWYCVQLSMDEQTGHLGASIDGTAIAGLTQDGVPTPDIDSEWLGEPKLGPWMASLVDASFGWRNYSGTSNTVWFDDIAVGDAVVPCP